MGNPVFVLGDALTIDAPVHIKVPQSVRPTGGKVEQKFVTRTAYVTFRYPDEDELDDVIYRVNKQNLELLEKVREIEAEEPEEAEQKAARDERARQARSNLRTAQIEQLKQFVVGLPSGHGFAEADGSPCVHSPDTIERLCKFRLVRNALWDAFLLILNGDAKKGN